MTSKIISALAAVLGLATLQSASAAGTYTVNTVNDTHAANPAASALDGSNNVSLRSAIEAASAQTGITTINVPAGTYKLRAWHERMPAQIKEVTVPADGAVSMDFILGITGLPQY